MRGKVTREDLARWAGLGLFYGTVLILVVEFLVFIPLIERYAK